MKNNIKKVVLISIENINNVGDELLRTNTEYLIKKYNQEIDVDRMNLHPSKKELGLKYIFNIVLAKFLFVFSNKFLSGNIRYIVKNYGIYIRNCAYFKNKLQNYDAIVFAIGMLKFSTQDQSYPFELINSIAKEYNIPVMMSAMSIEKYNERDWRCRQLVRAVNNPVVKCITTRDNEKELEILRNKYLTKNKNCYIDCVGDPALWTKETYQINEESANSDLIGIGLIRLGIYEDYGYNITKEQLFDLYVNIIKELDERKLNWVLFCNGMPEDYEVGLRLLKKLNLPQSKLLSRPETPKDLINILLSFKCVMGARLHSCITSYALGIPVVGLIWDNKLRAFAKKIGWEKYFVEENELDAKVIVDMLERVSNCKYDNKKKILLKNKTLNSIYQFIHNK